MILLRTMTQMTKITADLAKKRVKMPAMVQNGSTMADSG